MKLFGSLKELVSAVFRKDTYEITVKPNSGTYTGAVEVQLPPKLTGNDVLVGEATTQTLSNKTLVDTVTIVDSADNTKQLVLDAAGTTGTKTTVISSQTVNRTIYLPDVNGNIVTTGDNGTITSQMIANGTIANVDINSAADIARSKIAPGTGDYVVFNNAGSGYLDQEQYLNKKRGGAGADMTNVTFPSTGTLVTEAGTQTLTNKTIGGSQISGNISGNAANVTGTVAVANGGTGSTTASGARTNLSAASSGANSDITSLTGLTTALSIGQGGSGQTTANAALNAFLPTQGSSAGKYLKTDGTNTSWAAASGGSGEVNAILNPSAADGTTGWAAATNYTVAANSANSPLNPAVATCFALSTTTASVESSTSGISYAGFTMPAGLLNRKLKIEFFANIPATADGVWRLSLYDSTGTRVALSTDASGITTLPGGVNGKFVAYFDATNSATYSLRLTQTTRTNANTLYITNVIVGPGIQPQGAVVGPWQSYTPTLVGVGTPTITYAEWRRVGQTMEIRARFITGTVSADDVTCTLPTGYTISQAVGTSSRHAGSGVTNNTLDVAVLAAPTTSLLFFGQPGAASGFTALQGTTLGSSKTVAFTAAVSIAEWAGSGTVNVAQNDVEYAYNSAAWSDASDTTSFGYGSSGVAFAATDLTTTRSRRVRFQSPIQATDSIQVEVYTNGEWVPASGARLASTNALIPFGYWNANVGTGTAGIGLSPVSGSTTDIDVIFGRYSAVHTGTTGVAWSVAVTANDRWRVRKVSGGAAVGFGLADTTSAGLVSTQAQTFAGAKTFSSLVTVPNGTTTQPGLAFSSSSTTGISRSTASRIDFITSGTNAGYFSGSDFYVTNNINCTGGTLTTGGLVITGASTNASAPGLVQTYLRLNINGTTYKIALLGNT